GADDGGLLLVGIQRFHKSSGEVFLTGEDAQAFARALAHFSRVAAEERWSRGEEFTIDDRKVGRAMVPFHAPAPGAFRLRLAEHEEMIKQRVARELASGTLLIGENWLKAHDVGGRAE